MPNVYLKAFLEYKKYRSATVSRVKNKCALYLCADSIITVRKTCVTIGVVNTEELRGSSFSEINQEMREKK